MRDSINDYINYLTVEKGLSINTKYSYAYDLESFYEYFKNRNIKELETSDISNYLIYLKDKKKLSARSIDI